MTTPQDSFAPPPPPSPGRCPTIEQLIRGACGELPPSEYDRILGHVRNCPTCAKAWFAAGGRLQPAAPVEAAAGPSRPASLPQAPPLLPETKTSARGPHRLLIAIVVIFGVIVALGLLMVVLSNTLSNSLSPIASRRMRRNPYRVTTTNPPAGATSTTGTPSVLREITGLGGALRQLHESNAQIRRQAMERLQRGRQNIFQLQPVSGNPGADAVAASRRAERFSVVLSLPSSGISSVDLVAPDGRRIWLHQIPNGMPQLKVNFPARSLSTGTYHMNAITPSGAPAAQYIFAVID